LLARAQQAVESCGQSSRLPQQVLARCTVLARRLDLIVGIDVQGTISRTDATLDLCRAALARGPLIRDGNHWRCGRRRFSNTTVQRLIDQGAAVRDGSKIRTAVCSKESADRSSL